jgi:hypothetical protein
MLVSKSRSSRGKGAKKTIFTSSNDENPASNNSTDALVFNSNIKRQPTRIPIDASQTVSHGYNIPSGITMGKTEISSNALAKVRKSPKALLSDKLPETTTLLALSVYSLFVRDRKCLSQS